MQLGLCTFVSPSTSFLQGRKMGRIVVLPVVAGIFFLSGCQAPVKNTTAPPADEETLRLVRQSFTASDPTAIVGLVIAVLPDQLYAAVGDVDVKDFNEGDAISFIDSDKKFLVNGVVKKVTSDALHIQYQPPAPNSRAPKVGDLAVRFKP
jgi:hypothetical protein